MLTSKNAALLACLLLSCVFGPRNLARAGALEDVDRAASSGSGSGGSSSSSTSSGRSERADCGDDDDCDDALALLFAYVITSPWTIPRAFDVPCFDGYGPYPFHDGSRLLRSSSEGCLDGGLRSSRRAVFDAEVESGFLLEGVVPATLSLRAHLPRRFELSARLSLLTDVFSRPTPFATAATGHVLYRHAQTSRAEFRTGIGARLFALDVLRAGIDFVYAVDAYLRRRGVLRIELHLGSLGNAVVGEARATVGVMIRRTEVYAGYDHTGFGNVETSASLGGPVAGVRMWF